MELKTYFRKPDSIQTFQWHTSDGVVPGFVNEQDGNYFLPGFGGIRHPINDGDWVVQDANGTITRIPDAEFQRRYIEPWPTAE